MPGKSKAIRRGEKTGEVVYLNCQSLDKNSYPFPFFPDELYDKIYEENQEALRSKQGGGKSNANDNDQPAEFSKDDQKAMRNWMHRSLKGSLKGRRVSLSGQMNLEDISQENKPLQPQVLYPIHKLSVVINNFKDYIARNMQDIKATKERLEKKKSTLEKILEVIGMTPDELKKAVEDKKALFKRWKSTKISREQVVTQREKPKNLVDHTINAPHPTQTPQTPQDGKNDPEQNTGIDDKYPKLKAIKQLPHDIQLQRRSMTRGQLPDFKGSIYQTFRADKSPVDG